MFLERTCGEQGEQIARSLSGHVGSRASRSQRDKGHGACSLSGHVGSRASRSHVFERTCGEQGEQIARSLSGHVGSRGRADRKGIKDMELKGGGRLTETLGWVAGSNRLAGCD